MSLYQLFQPKGPSGFGYGSTAQDVTAGLSLAGKTMLVTGCNAGLGKETLQVLAMRGAKVVGTARTIEKAREACDAAGGQTLPLACELSPSWNSPRAMKCSSSPTISATSFSSPA
jgi:WW domain-containing oxidoreductase